MQEPVIIALPPKGGSLDDVLKRLVRIGWLDGELVAAVRQFVRDDKRRVKLEEGLIHLWEAHGADETATMRAADDAGHDLDEVTAAMARMRRYRDDDGVARLCFSPKAVVDDLLQALRQDPDPVQRAAAGMLHLELDLGRFGRPTRMMFDHLEFTWDGVRGVLVGTDHEVTPTYLRRHKRDLSLTCYDAFQNTLLDAVDTGLVHNWCELMEHLIETSTDVRILGSLGLGDYLGHFVLMPAERAARVAASGAGSRWGGSEDAKLAILAEEPVLIDANYEAIYRNLLEGDGCSLRFESTTRDIEDMVAGGRSAVYIVRSGSTIAATPGVCVVGHELVTSETIVAVNRERMEANPGIGRLVESLAPEASDGSRVWRESLRRRLGDKLVLPEPGDPGPACPAR
ncbi:MAG: hypothetical protein ACOCZK_02740 [Planctomycetota bacterium]